MELSIEDVRMLVNGHNGLRNRVAVLPKSPVANMNMVHWDTHLEQMAEGWIKQCTIDTDSCEFIREFLYFIEPICSRPNILERIVGEPDITVGQNIRFEFAEQMPQRWIVRTVTHWFLHEFIKKGEFGRSNCLNCQSFAFTQGFLINIQ